MSTVFPNIDGWVGWTGGREILLRSDEAWDSDHPLVKERPELFRPAVAPTPARPVAKKSSKAAPDA